MGVTKGFSESVLFKISHNLRLHGAPFDLHNVVSVLEKPYQASHESHCVLAKEPAIGEIYFDSLIADSNLPPKIKKEIKVATGIIDCRNVNCIHGSVKKSPQDLIEY